jgi:hypothetical protein
LGKRAEAIWWRNLDLAGKSPARALSARDPAAAAIRDDELYSGSDSRRLGLGERDLPVVW